MTKKSLNDHMVTYYKAKRLPPELRADLLAAIEDSNQKKVGGGTKNFQLSSSFKTFFSPRRFAFASVLLALGYVVWIVNGIPNNSEELQTDLTVAISREIGMNHTKRFKVEFEEQTITGLNQQMDKLNFTLLIPDRLPQSLAITGARYCSIMGRIAAQIQMTDSNGHYYTLYQTKLIKLLSTLKESSLNIDGVEYILWHEDGVFLGFAGPSE